MYITLVGNNVDHHQAKGESKVPRASLAERERERERKKE